MSTKTIEKHNNKYDVRKMVMLAMFVALAYASLFVCHMRMEFLSFEPKDSIIILSAFIYGPLAGALVAVITSVIEMLTISATGVYGLIMNIAGSVTLALVTGFIYKYKRTLVGAVISLIVGVVVMTAVMVGANILITPGYMGVPRQVVIDLVAPTLIPFNLTKGVFNASVVMILYKPFVTALRAVGIMPNSKAITKQKAAASAAVTVVAILILAATLALFIFKLGGSFKFV